MLRRIALAGLLCLVTLPLVACDRAARDGPDEITVGHLQEKVREALGDVRRARSDLPEATDEAAASLAAAELRLRRLDEYYLPLVAARQQVAAALASAEDRPGAARSAVDSAEAVLMGIVRGHGPHLETEMREPLEWTADARAALEAGDAEEARAVLRRLEEHLSSIFFRGNLVLEDSELDPDADSVPR